MTVIRAMNRDEKIGFVEMLNAGDYYPALYSSDLIDVPCYGVFDFTGELLGGVMIIQQEKHAYLDYLYVSPEYRNLGHGVRLLDVVRMKLKEQGVKYVYACINGANELSGRLAARHHGKVGFPFLHVRIELEDDHG